MHYPNPYMLVYIAMADAYAIAAEYLEGDEYVSVRDKCLQFEGYVEHPKLKIPPGNYTDDTEMSAANAHVLLMPWRQHTRLVFADAYVEEHQRGAQRRGYSRELQRILAQCQNGADLLRFIGGRSNKNGAAMRAVPFGVMRNIHVMFDIATLQARITHDTPEGRFSARAVALMSHFALYASSPLTGLAEYCRISLPVEDRGFFYVFEQPWDGGPVTERGEVSVAITTVQAVFTLVTREHSLMDMLRRAITWGGDTDSVAAITWGIASARYRNEQLPQFLYRDLERGSAVTGVRYLQWLGTELMTKYT